MKTLKKNPRNWGYIHETDEFIIDYFDIFFCSYDPRVVKAEKTVKSKITKKQTNWRAWFDLPEDLAKDLKVDKLLDNWPPKNPELEARFDTWLEERLLSDDEWIEDSTNRYDLEQHSLSMVSFTLLENIHQAVRHNSGLPRQIREFLDEAKKVLKKGEHQFEYLEVYSEIIQDSEGNEIKEFIVESDDSIRLSNISKIQLFNRLSHQGWILDFQDKDGHYIFKRSFEIITPTVLGNQTREFYYESSLNLEFSQLHLHKKTIRYLYELGISVVKDLLDTVNSIDELQQNLASISKKYENEDEDSQIFFVDDVAIDIEKLKRIFQADKGVSLQEAVFAGFLVPIEMLQLSARGYNALKRNQIYVVADLMEYSFNDLLEFKNMTRRAALNIRESLDKNLGLSLKMD